MAHFGKREKYSISLHSFQRDLAAARDLNVSGESLKAFDVYEQLAVFYPEHSIALLAELYDGYQALPQRDRYNLYQSRHFDFGIRPGDKVLDIGSGHIPFPLATHLSDITLTDHGYGRAGVPFKHVEGKPVFECSVERIPFDDKQFDFVYCSHVLEHAKNPDQACQELMRVAKRGFIECPAPGKDLFLDSSKVSNHGWGIEVFDDRLIFSEYTPEQIEAFQCNILQQMHSAPQNEREKAFSALIYLKANLVNTMLLWAGEFEFEVRRLVNKRVCSNSRQALSDPAENHVKPVDQAVRPPVRPGLARKFVQIHTFYSSYLESIYNSNPALAGASFVAQSDALFRDGFSGIHMFAPYMAPLGYDSQLIIANNPRGQEQWLRENGVELGSGNNWIHEVARLQIDTIKPEILYLSDPITFDSRFIKTLSHRPALILGWRAANIPEGTDWSDFDVILSSLTSLREVALMLGARAVEHFFPGYPAWANELIADTTSQYDVVFSGQWTQGQHPRRNSYLQSLAVAAARPKPEFSLGMYLSGETASIPPEVARFNKGGLFGIAMLKGLRTGRIAIDARGILEIKDPATGMITDLAGRETANMRIFEVTGSGVFLLSEHHDNLREYFEPGWEIETFKDENELLEKIRFYLAHPAEREAIARRGQERCLRDYSMENRARELDRIIRKHLQNSVSTAQPPAEKSAEQLRAEALPQFEKGDHLQALDLLIQAKSLKQPVQGVDLLRAKCFLRMGQELSALEALREELRYFPTNDEAREFLEQLQQRTAPALPVGGDNEFRQLHKAIRPYTMLSEERLYSLFTLAKGICERNIPGNFVECGVAAGGSSALLAWVIKQYSKLPRRLFSFDSFSGMPAPTSADTHAGQPAEDTGWGTGTCAAPEESVRDICARIGVLDVVTTVKGYFEETLPVWRDRIGMLSLLHMDGDWYESTKAILINLYERINNDGLLQVDDYGHWDGCRKAIHEFEATRDVNFSISTIDATGVWFPKPDRFPANTLIPEKMIADFNEIDPVPMGIEVQMSPNERFQLFYVVRSMLPRFSSPLRFIEVGSYAGGSLALTYMALRKTVSRIEGYSIEPGGQAGFAEVLGAIGNDVTHLPLFSYQAAPRLGQIFADGNLPELILIDGDHSYEGVRRDIIDYYSFLAPGGIILFHDWLPPLDANNREAILSHHGGAEPGIRQACAEILEGAHGLSPIELPLLYPSNPVQTQAHLQIIPGVFSTIKAYRKPEDRQ